MSPPPSSGDDVAYDPVPNPQELPDIPEAPYDPLSEPYIPTPPADDLNPDEPSINLVRPRFLGPIDGEDIRQSLASYSSQPHSEGVSSLYALNPESLSLRGSTGPASDIFLGRYRDDPRSHSEDNFDGPSVPLSNLTTQPRFLAEKEAVYTPRVSKSRRNLIILSAIGGVILLIVAVVLPVYFLAIKHTSNKVATNKGPDTTTASPSATSSSSPKSLTTGGNGSIITMENGTKFTYVNEFGGFWIDDPNSPFNNSAQAQSWSPPLNQPFDYDNNRVRGVNLGGWLVTEPFIAPSLYQKYNGTVDEWTLSVAMASDTANGGLSQLEEHYKTFITEQDFAEIAGAGLNWVRIPLPYWALEVRDGEPFLKQTAWNYFLKGIRWARKYGIRINLDFHALPGSQNGWNHSGRLGTVNVLNGPMGLANAERSLDYIRILAEFISQPQYKDVVVMFGITNEPQGSMVGQENLSRYYLQAYNYIRLASGTGSGNGPMISFHDGFLGADNWAGFLPGADRVALDLHTYLCFTTQSSSPMSGRVNEPCSGWGSMMNSSMDAFGVTAAGEFSCAINDCGFYVNGVGLGTRYEGTYPGYTTKVGDCSSSDEWENWDQSLKSSTKQFAMASMDSLGHFFFWTWKIGPKLDGTIRAPYWSYKLGYEQGWLPKDPRDAVGVCGNSNPRAGSLAPSQTGGSGAGQIPASVSSKFAWPPTSISSAGAAVSLLPHYTRTGSIPTLPVPTFSASSSINAGNGWENSADTLGLAVPIATCSYPDPWMESGFTVPPACGTPSTGTRRDVVRDVPVITPGPIPSR